MAKGEKIGSGRRFRQLEAKLAGKPGVKNPGALAAHIGRQKYGATRFAELAKAGQKRAAGQPPKPTRRVRV